MCTACRSALVRVYQHDLLMTPVCLTHVRVRTRMHVCMYACIHVGIYASMHAYMPTEPTCTDCAYLRLLYLPSSAFCAVHGIRTSLCDSCAYCTYVCRPASHAFLYPFLGLLRLLRLLHPPGPSAPACACMHAYMRACVHAHATRDTRHARRAPPLLRKALSPQRWARDSVVSGANSQECDEHRLDLAHLQMKSHRRKARAMSCLSMSAHARYVTSPGVSKSWGRRASLDCEELQVWVVAPLQQLSAQAKTKASTQLLLRRVASWRGTLLPCSSAMTFSSPLSPTYGESETTLQASHWC